MALLALWVFVLIYQSWFHSIEVGIHLAILSWSLFVLCIPVAHGRFVFGVPIYLVTGIKVRPEIFLWTLAMSINVMSLIFMPFVYEDMMLTHFLYRLLVNPFYYPIFAFSFLAALYRSVIEPNIALSRFLHSIIRHVIVLTGLLLLFYLAHQEFIIVFNAHANR